MYFYYILQSNSKIIKIKNHTIVKKPKIFPNLQNFMLFLKDIIHRSHINSPTEFISLGFVVNFFNRDIIFFAPEKYNNLKKNFQHELIKKKKPTMR